MQVSTLGIDLAKSVFQLHGVDHNGNTVLRKRLSRARFVQFVINLPPCLIGMEACSSSHHFGRLFREHGHQVKLIPPQYVKPYVKTNKTDAADAEAICEAVTRPNMRFVEIKTVEQQAVLTLHIERSLLIRERTAVINSLRAMLAEFGFVIPGGRRQVHQCASDILGDDENGLSPLVRSSAARQLAHIRELDNQLSQVEKELTAWFRSRPDCQRVAQVPGVGLLTATYVVASVGNVQQFGSAKQFAACVGLTPREHSSGGHQKWGTSANGGTAIFASFWFTGRERWQPGFSEPVREPPWLLALMQRKPHNVAVTAQANKTTRILWAMLRRGTEYHPATPA
ncbi:IS110 family transposase [Jejubacter calystegiae]|uniref:IS110 family transposase n=1 Tax=Jejubacter calystegiae TaxID=2579935 RepID=UPI001F4FB556|nr:IS110 family transposase [Jejubacter calystegiae]